VAFFYFEESIELFIMMEEKVKSLILDTIKSLGLRSNGAFTLDYLIDLKHGDISSNVALVLARENKISSLELAQKMVQEIKLKPASNFFSQIEVAGAGFINFFLSPDCLNKEIKSILQDTEGRSVSSTRGEKVIVEYTDPNPFKEFHIGHLMTNTIGEAISRLIEASGFEVKRVCYQGDVGLHVAKAIFGAQKMQKERGMIDWHQVYALGSKAYDLSPQSKQEIEEINRRIYARDDSSINALYEEGRRFSLGEFENIYKILGTKFDYYFFESEVSSFGKEIVARYKNKVFEESEGAVVFRGEKYGLHTRVFINKDGLPTYEAKELGLAKIKHDKYPYDRSIIITANEVNDYFKVLLLVMSFVFPDLAIKTKHIGHGMLRLPTGKMSSRTGQVITAKSLIETLEKMVRIKIKNRDLNTEEKLEVENKVAVAAVKYAILRQAIGSDIIFDFDKSISFDGDSGPYLQYSYARAISVLRRFGESEERLKSIQFEIFTPNMVERLLVRFPHIVTRAASEYAPHRLTHYLTELASAFNNFYANNQIIGDSSETNRRIALTRAFSLIMKKGLNLLGIPVLEKM
jgi:arginyl-tRNA synthetase